LRLIGQAQDLPLQTYLRLKIYMKKQLFSFLVLLSFLTSVSAQAIKPTVAEKNLRTHVAYLASDRLEGRRTGEQGATFAAGYVANMFAQYKLKAGFGANAGGKAKSNFLQSFPYVTGSALGEDNALEFKSKETGAKAALKLKDEWMPLGFSTSEAVTNLPLVDVGYGITAKGLNYDDYRGADVKNSVALAIDGAPDKKLEQFADVRRKALAAREAGAKALIILVDIKQEKFTKLIYDNQGDAGLPVVVMSHESMSKAYQFNLPKTGVAARSSDGTEIHYRGDTSITTKPDGTTIVEKADGTTFTYKTEIVKEENGSYIKRADGKTIVKNPDGTSVELENDYLLRETLGTKEEDFTVSVSVELNRKTADAYNVVGILEGTDAALKNEAIVVGAHYDHLGKGGAGSLAVNSTEIHHGADDNASGVAAMLELARQFAKDRKNKRTLIFIAFGGEEEGLVGSKFYVNNPAFPIAKTVAMINLDMVGRLNENKLTVGGIGTASDWNEMVKRKNDIMFDTDNGYGVGGKFALQLNEDGFGPSDHSSFYGKQVPVLFFFTGTHADYHKPSDTAEKINYEGLIKVTNFVGEIVKAIDQNPTKPTYTVAKSAGMGGRTTFNVSLGTVPSYAEGNDGLLLDAVRDDSPAAKSGLKAGDKIIKLAGRDIRNISDYVFILGEMKAGVEYEVVVKRGAETLTLKIVPAARK
jgi:hypothetical protein